MNKHSILIIDDEVNNFEVFEALLASEDYELYYANNGAEALASLDKFDPDIILLDLAMPEMDGWEVCQRIRLMRKWRSIPIIMVTASEGKTVIAQCLDAGADDFIRKPVDSVELKARIKSMLRIKQQFDRIESLNKLQQHNITSLENSLVELVRDLTLSFASEFSPSLLDMQEQIADLSKNIDNFDRNRSRYLVDSVNESVANLHQKTSKFWEYMNLAIDKHYVNSDCYCNIKEQVEQISMIQAQSLNRENDLAIDLDPAQIKLTDNHCELMVKELLDYIFQFSAPGVPIQIFGRTIDRLFHLIISDCDSPQSLFTVASARENHSSSEQELMLGMKIVKKIVDLYDGTLTIDTTDTQDTIIQVVIPLARA